MAEKILIAGAGIGGLATASCLMKAGYDVEMYEQAPELTEVGAGIQLAANAMHVLNDIGLGPALSKTGVRPGAYVFRLHDTGEEIARFALSDEHEAMHGAPYYQAHRSDLLDLLVAKARAFKPDVINLNSTVTGFEEDDDGVTLLLADGRRPRGDILIGADGLKSVIRAQIAGRAARADYTGDAAWRIVVPVEKLPKDFLEPVMSVFMGPHRHVVCYYLRRGKLLNFVGCVETEEVSEESWTAKFSWEKLKSDFEGWHPAIQSVIDAADRDACFRWSLHYRNASTVWNTRRVTIMGDAAHPTLPYLAQGACMAIEDGAVLTRALGMKDDPAEALDLFVRNRIDRTTRIVEQSTYNRELFHLPSEDEIRARFANRDEGKDRNTWLYSYNALTVPLE
jgi:salicylate hydroxylase